MIKVSKKLLLATELYQRRDKAVPIFLGITRNQHKIKRIDIRRKI